MRIEHGIAAANSEDRLAVWEPAETLTRIAFKHSVSFFGLACDHALSEAIDSHKLTCVDLDECSAQNDACWCSANSPFAFNFSGYLENSNVIMMCLQSETGLICKTQISHNGLGSNNLAAVAEGDSFKKTEIFADTPGFESDSFGPAN